jgi:hypothetical protein
MVYDYKKFCADIVEDKINCKTDFVGFVKYLEDRNHLKNAYSIWYRHSDRFDFPLFGKLKRLVHAEAYVDNQLNSQDSFAPSSANINPESDTRFLTLADLGYQESSVQWVDQSNFAECSGQILDLSAVGIDAEFYKEDYSMLTQPLLATIQIAGDNRVFVIDCLSLAKNPALKNLIIVLLANPMVLKAGHSFNSDLEVIERSLECKISTMNNFLDFGFDTQTNRQVSLATLVDQHLNARLCKMEQASAWNKRPLRKAQMHYAALDAVVCLKLASMRDQIKAYRMISCETAAPKTTLDVQRPVGQPPILGHQKLSQMKQDKNVKVKLELGLEPVIVSNTPLGKNRAVSSPMSLPNKNLKADLMTNNARLKYELPGSIADLTTREYDQCHEQVSKRVGLNNICRLKNWIKSKNCLTKKTSKSHMSYWPSNLDVDNDSLALEFDHRNSKNHISNKKPYVFRSFGESNQGKNSCRSTNSSLEAQPSTITAKHPNLPVTFLVDSELSDLILNMRKLGLNTISTSQASPCASTNQKVIRVSLRPISRINDRFFLVQNSDQRNTKSLIEAILHRFELILNHQMLLSRCLGCNSEAFKWRDPFSNCTAPPFLGTVGGQELEQVWLCEDCGFEYRVKL